jgi:membrane protein YqaA with SNARE-associated domain
MIQTLQNFVENFDPLWQWLSILLVAAIPGVESDIGSAFGVIAGINPVITVMAAVAGNLISIIIFVFFGDKLQNLRKNRKKETAALTARKQKIKDRFDKYGIPGVSLLGQTILPSQITAMTMVTFGASRNRVIFWQALAITLWGTIVGTLVSLGFNVFA